MQITSTDRLLIREFKHSDLESLHSLLSDPDVMKYSVNGVYDITKTEKFLHDMINSYTASKLSMWAIIVDNSFIGICGFMPTDDNTFEIGYRILPNYQGEGYATEACNSIKNHAINKCGLNNFIAYIERENASSVKVANKIGMTLVKDGLYKNIPVLIYEYDTTKKEWLTKLEGLRQIFIGLKTLYSCTIPSEEYNVTDRYFNCLNTETIKLILGKLYVLLADTYKKEKFNTISFKLLILDIRKNQNYTKNTKIIRLLEEINKIEDKYETFRNKFYAHTELTNDNRLMRIEDLNISNKDITYLLNLSQKAYDEIFLLLDNASSDHMAYEIENLSNKLWKGYIEQGLAQAVKKDIDS